VYSKSNKTRIESGGKMMLNTIVEGVFNGKRRSKIRLRFEPRVKIFVEIKIGFRNVRSSRSHSCKDLHEFFVSYTSESVRV